MRERLQIEANTKRLPYGLYLAMALGLALTGLIVSGYLSVSHYRAYTDIHHRSFCAVSQAINCDTVSQSPYSIFWGMPVPVWGLFGYAGMVMLLLFAALRSAGRKRIWTAAMGLSLVYGLTSLALAAVSTFKIGSWCILCIATYAVNLLLIFTTWIVRRRFRIEPLVTAACEDVRYLWHRRRVALPLFASVAVAFLLTQQRMPHYWELQPPMSTVALPTGLTPEGLPWIGAESPRVTIVEFADYQCFQCRKMHFYLRELAARHPGAIRIVHRHYPMDSEFNFVVPEPFHVGSGKLALLALHAEAKGKFWEMNDLLYALAGRERSIEIAEVAGAVGIDGRELAAALEHPFYRDRLNLDIRQGMKLRILGTPTYVIDGKVYQGNIPPDVLAGILEQVGEGQGA